MKTTKMTYISVTGSQIICEQYQKRGIDAVFSDCWTKSLVGEK